MLRRRLWILMGLMIGWILVPVAVDAAGGSSQPVPEVQITPEQQATEHYNNGLRLRDRAWKLEEKAAEETDAGRRAKLDEKIARQWQQAIQEQRLAVTYNPRLHQAFSSLGYALRKSGDYDSSLVAYDRALELAPGYAEAIEYRAEAYLALDRLEEAKSAYMTLLTQDRPRSGELLVAMRRWVESRRAAPTDLAPGEVEAFAQWVAQREELAEQTSALGGAGSESW